LQPLKTDVCNKCLRLTFDVVHSTGEEKNNKKKDLIHHQLEARNENLAMKEMNFVIVVLEKSEEFKSEVFRRDCDPASNCYWPKYPEQPSCAYRMRAITVNHVVLANVIGGPHSSFFWPQQTAKKGVNECISCLEWEIKNKITESQLVLAVGIDNCSGNYHNSMFIGYCCYKLVTTKLEMFIVHSKIPGHTYFLPDRASAPFRRELNSQPVYCTEDLVNIANSVQSLSAIEMVQENFHNWKEYLKNFFVHISTHDYHLFMGTISSLQKGVIFRKKRSSEDHPWESVPIFREDFELEKMKNTTPSRLYLEPIPVRIEVQWEVYEQREYVPEKYRHFYTEPSQIKKKSSDDEEEEEEEEKRNLQEILEDYNLSKKNYEQERAQFQKQEK